jgi:hypothetical protein
VREVRDGARQSRDTRTAAFDPLWMLQLDRSAVVYGPGAKCQVSMLDA